MWGDHITGAGGAGGAGEGPTSHTMDAPLGRHLLPPGQGSWIHVPLWQTAYVLSPVQVIAPGEQSLGATRVRAPTRVPTAVVVRTGLMGCGSFMVCAPSAS